MRPASPFYPLVLQAVLNHAARLGELLGQRERTASPFEDGSLWLTGRATELHCVAAMAAVDWHEGRLSAKAAAGRLARYVRDLHDGMAMHLDIATPSCCRPPYETVPGIGTDLGRAP